MTAHSDLPMAAAPGAVAERTVLLVDDSAAQRRVVSRMLERWGYSVVEAESAASALEIAASRTIHIVISDWIMPGMSGVDFCRAFRALQRTSYGYFLLLTSKSGKEDVATGLEAGADDFLTKPVNSGELHARIRAGERLIETQEELQVQNRRLETALDELRTIQAEIDKDLQEARRFQMSMVPTGERTFDGARLTFMLRPSGHVGGDFVGVFPVNDSRLGLFSIDVSGHGIASALLAARIAGYLNGTSPDQNIALTTRAGGGIEMRPPNEVCARLNDLMLGQLETDLYLTMLLAECDLVTGRLSIAQAGHPNPILQRQDGTIERLGEGGLPVGLIPGAAWGAVEARLGPGDRFLAFSDGITECPGDDGQDFGDAGFEAFLTENASVRGTDLHDSLNWQLDLFAGEAGVPDDVSLAVLEFRGRS